MTVYHWVRLLRWTCNALLNSITGSQKSSKARDAIISIIPSFPCNHLPYFCIRLAKEKQHLNAINARFFPKIARKLTSRSSDNGHICQQLQPETVDDIDAAKTTVQQTLPPRPTATGTSINIGKVSFHRKINSRGKISSTGCLVASFIRP